MELIYVPNGRPKFLNELEDKIVVGTTWIVSLEAISIPKTKNSVLEVATERPIFFCPEQNNINSVLKCTKIISQEKNVISIRQVTCINIWLS